MTALTALIRRELLEHRGAFLYAPVIVVAGLFVVLAFAITMGDTQVSLAANEIPSAYAAFELAIAVVYAAWFAYLMIALFFYYADSFSADRRNNALLFWKSMPQSDFKVLGAKALAGITIFPALIVGFAFLTGILAYILVIYVDTKLPFPIVPSLFDAVAIWLRMAVFGTIFMALNILWFAPFFGWVAGLSTLFQRWSIPLAFLIPAVLVLIESILGTGNPGAPHPIRDYLHYRTNGPGEDLSDQVLERMLVEGGWSSWDIFRQMLATTDWLQLAIGLVVTILLVYLASEYRRRRIEA